jgi:hypothetical protein
METRSTPKEGKNKSELAFKTGQKIAIFLLFIMIFTGCSKEDGGSILDSAYSGTGNFNFTGDFDMTFIGNVTGAEITSGSNGESIPLSFVDSQGKIFFIGLRDNPKIEARTYTMEDIFTEGYASIELSGELYDSGAIGGTGTVTISTLNSGQIKGTVDMKLARPLNTADTVIVKGSFQLKGQ